MGKFYLMPVVPQVSTSTCWEACARMMWLWRWRNGPLKDYIRAIGHFASCAIQNKGLLPDQIVYLYHRRLGMRITKRPKGSDVKAALSASPVALAYELEWFIPRGRHVVVICGNVVSEDGYLVTDPQANPTQVGWEFRVDGSADPRIRWGATTRMVHIPEVEFAFKALDIFYW